MKFFFTSALALCALTSALAAPAPTALPPATQLEIESLLRHPGIQNARIGVAVVALGEALTPAQFPALPYDNGAQPLLFGRDETKRFTPASNFKLFTATWALKTLGPKATLQTQVVAAPVEFLKDGAWPVNETPPTALTLIGGGDPSLDSAAIKAMARQITDKIAGDDKGYFIVRAQNSPAGDLLNAEFGGRRYPDGWTLDDALWYYGPVVTGLAVNRNQVDVTIVGAEKAGELATTQSDPAAPFPILSTVTTVTKDDARAGKISWDRGDADSPLGQTLRLRGFIAVGAETTEGIAVPDPTQWAANILADEIKAAGGKIAQISGYKTEQSAVVATHQSAPMGTLINRFLKNSDNLYGEMLLRRAGATVPDEPLPPNSGASISSDGLAAIAHRDMIRWLVQNKVPTQGLRLSDGSGLSRYDTLTPLAITRLLGVAQTLDGGDLFYSSLPIAGVDGTLRNRFKGSAAEGNLHAKTGTFSIVNCLSGYVTTRDGQRLAVSILTNFVEDGELARRWQGRVMATLANASWAEK